MKEEMANMSQDRQTESVDAQRNAVEEDNRPSARDDEGKKDKTKRKLA